MSRLLVRATHNYVVTKVNQLKLLPFDFIIKTCFWRSCVKSDGLPVPMSADFYGGQAGERPYYSTGEYRTFLTAATATACALK